MSSFFRYATGLLLIATMAACSSASAASGPVPAPLIDAELSAGHGLQKAVIAGGCFWGIQAVFQHVKGVKQAISGYSGGSEANAHYEIVSTGSTGHAESVQIAYDPSQITYGQLLRVFFSVAHDPTEINRQGPDDGSQYRSVIFYADAEQKNIAEAYIDQLNTVGAFTAPIATQVVPLTEFYAAEDYHQDYARLHPNDMYIMINDAPKVTNLRKVFPDLYVAK